MRELYLTPKKSFQRNRQRSNIVLYAAQEDCERLQRKKKSNDRKKNTQIIYVKLKNDSIQSLYFFSFKYPQYEVKGLSIYHSFLYLLKIFEKRLERRTLM